MDNRENPPNVRKPLLNKHFDGREASRYRTGSARNVHRHKPFVADVTPDLRFSALAGMTIKISTTVRS